MCTALDQRIDTYIQQEAVRLAALSNYATRRPSGDGQHQEWTIDEITAYSFLTETEASFQPPYTAALTESARVWPLTLSFLERPIPLIGHVYGSRGEGLEATITVATLVNILPRRASSNGLYHLFLPNGEYVVRFSASGFRDREERVLINTSRETILNVVLSPVESQQ
jgi:hypothetical protein